MEHDYLRDGFWAMTREEELPNKGLTVSFLESLDKYNVKVIGVQVDAIERGEDRIEFKKTMDRLGQFVFSPSVPVSSADSGFCRFLSADGSLLPAHQ